MQTKPVGQSSIVVQSRAQNLSPSGAVRHSSVVPLHCAEPWHCPHCWSLSGTQNGSPSTRVQYVPSGHSGGHVLVQIFWPPTCTHWDPSGHSWSVMHDVPTPPAAPADPPADEPAAPDEPPGPGSPLVAVVNSDPLAHPPNAPAAAVAIRETTAKAHKEVRTPPRALLLRPSGTLDSG